MPSDDFELFRFIPIILLRLDLSTEVFDEMFLQDVVGLSLKGVLF
jgi:hypothetical protein